MIRLRSCLTIVVLIMIPAVAQAQGLLVVVDPDQQVRLPRPIIIFPPPHPPHPPHPPFPPPWPRPRPRPPVSYQVKSLELDARLTDQVARVQVQQTFVNTGSRQMEVAFVFPLPYDGAIEQMTLLVDGKEYPAKLLDKDEARRLYEQIVRKNKDPALLEWMGTGLFRTSVFPVPAGASRTVSLRYAQICRKLQGLTDLLIPLSTAKYTSDPVEQVHIRVAIDSREPIKNVYSPTHAVNIKRPDDQHATVTFTAKNEIPSTDFRLLYDVGKGKLSARVISYRPDRDEDGYFLLLASPQIKAADQQAPKKTVIFVVDRSGSMSGKKIEQARGALRYVLNNLRPGDLFNIVAYDSQVEAFRPELQRFEDETRKAALGFIEGIYAGGSTNIDGALRAALGHLQDADRPTYLLFLTDGLPTAGETNEMKIVANAKEANRVRARVFCFGVGYDVNSRLLDKLMRENFGQSEYVRPDEDIEDRVSRLYRRIESPVMSDVQIEFVFDQRRDEEGKPVNRVYPKDSFDLFAGEQLVVVGRYRKAGTAKVIVQGKVGNQSQKFDFPAQLVEKSNDESHGYVEKLWAVRRVGEILDELDLKGKNDELIKELVNLSIRHGILTPYTSFMADENTNLRDLAANMARADRRLGNLAEASGVAGFAQRALKGSYRYAAQAPAVQLRAAPAMEAFRDYAAGASPVPAGPGAAAGRRAGASGGASFGREVVQEAESAQQTIRNVGHRTFYFRKGRWVDSQVTGEQEAHAQRIKQFSDEYFALARRYGKTMAQYMAFDEPVLLNIEGQAYLIEP